MSSASRLPCRTVSVISPVWNEEEGLKPFYDRTRSALESCGLEAYELIFVNDGSIDQTSMILQRIAETDPAVKVLTLSRNFGHHPAVFAGLQFASGEVVVVIDADLQDPPELIPALLAKRNEGYELVFARRTESQDSRGLQILKQSFRSLMRRISRLPFSDNIGVFSAMDASLKELLLKMPERERYLVAMQLYLGFRIGYVEYARDRRFRGRSKQSLGRLFRLGMNSLFAYSSAPLRISMLAGLVCLAVTLIVIAYILYSKLILHIAIPGWASVMTAILGMGTIQLLSLWIICEYVDRIFENTKGRPYFIIWKQVGAPGCVRKS